MTQKFVFVDRDGVINKDSPLYIKSWSEFDFLPGSLDAIRLLSVNGFHVIIITNQSVINRGTVSLSGLADIHARMREAVKAHGGDINDIFFCPHLPQDQCDCRKPQPGLILQARGKYGMDLEKTFMIGDSAKDIECALNAGCGGNILVRTGNGKNAEKILAEKGIAPTYIVEDLYEAAGLLTDSGKTSYTS